MPARSGDLVLPRPAIDQALAEHLVERARIEGLDLVGPNGLLAGLAKQVIEVALSAELTDHLGYEAHDPARLRDRELAQRRVVEDGPDRRRRRADRCASRPGGHVRTDDRAQAQAATGRLRRERDLALRQGVHRPGDIVEHLYDVYGAEVSRERRAFRALARCAAQGARWNHPRRYDTAGERSARAHRVLPSSTRHSNSAAAVQTLCVAAPR